MCHEHVMNIFSSVVKWLKKKLMFIYNWTQFVISNYSDSVSKMSGTFFVSKLPLGQKHMQTLVFILANIKHGVGLLVIKLFYYELEIKPCSYSAVRTLRVAPGKKYESRIALCRKSRLGLGLTRNRNKRQ